MGNNVVTFEQFSQVKQSEWIDRLFARLGAMYGSKFRAMWEGQDIAGVKSIWMEDLAEFSPAEITAGVNACKTREWPPTLPEFIRLCRPSIDYERAFYDAIEQMRRRDNGADLWPSPAIYWAAVSIGRDLSSRPYVEMRARWAKAVDDAVAAVKAGTKPNTVPARLTALPAPGDTTPDRETVRANLERLKAMVGAVVESKTEARGAA
jgi:hypothetical protein